MEKKYWLLLNMVCIITISFTQEIKTVKHKLSSNLSEMYEVLKTDKKIKNGSYVVLDDNKKILVRGNYKNNKKDSIWAYYSANGTVVQRYDYGEMKLLEDDIDNATIVQPSYELIQADSSTTNKDIEPPIKIGGNNYGFYLLYDVKLIPVWLKTETRFSSPTMSFILTVSPIGKLENWDVKITEADGKTTVENYSIKDLPNDAYEFIPAKVNGVTVKSKLILSVVLHINQDFNPSVGSNNMMVTPPKND